MDRFASSGCRAILQSRSPEALRNPVITGVPSWSRTISDSRKKVTVQSASQSEPTPIKVWMKPGIRYPVIGNPDGRWGKLKSPVPVDCWVCPVPVLNLTVGAERLMLTMEHLRQSRCP